MYIQYIYIYIQIHRLLTRVLSSTCPTHLTVSFSNPVRLVWSQARTFCETSGMKQSINSNHAFLACKLIEIKSKGVECPQAIGRGMALGTRKNPWELKVAGIHSCLIYGFIPADSHYKSTVCSPECFPAHAQLTWLSLFPTQSDWCEAKLAHSARHPAWNKASIQIMLFWLASSLK